MNEKFIRKLKRGEDRAHKDQKNMSDWENGKIDISVLFLKVCENNGIPDFISGIHLNENGEAIEKDGWVSDEIGKDEFVEWLNGIGYGV